MPRCPRTCFSNYRQCWRARLLFLLISPCCLDMSFPLWETLGDREHRARRNSQFAATAESDAKLGEAPRTAYARSRSALVYEFYEEIRSRKEEDVGFYFDQRRNRSAPLVPPKPKEFDMAYSRWAWRAWLGTKSMSPVSWSWCTRLMVGGMI